MGDPKGISFGEGVSPQSRRTDFAMVRVPARPARPLGLSLVLPRNWKDVPPPPSGGNKELSIAACFAPSNDASITVVQTRIPFEINLVDWLEYQCHARDFTIDKLETGHSQNGTEVHAAGHSSSGDSLRMAVVGDADRVLWLVGRSAARRAAEFAETLGLAAASIRILSPSGADSRESINDYQDTSSGLHLLYPASWQVESLRQLLPSKAATDFRLIEGGETVAYLRAEADFTLQSSEAFRRLYQVAVSEIEETGIRIRSMEAIPAGTAGDAEQRWLGSCDVRGRTGNVAMLFRRAPSCWMSAILLAPDKAVNPMAWMRGKRFFEIAVSSLSFLL